MDMKNLIGMMMVLGLVGCGDNNASTPVLNTNIDTCMTHVNAASTEYDLMSICGTPSSMSDGSYVYTGSKGKYVVSVLINEAFETAWNDKSLVGSAGVPYSYSMLQSYVDTIRISISNQGGDIYDTSSWIGGNESVAASYVTQIDEFKISQGANISLVTGITLNGIAQ